MISWRDSNFQPIQNPPDEAVQYASYGQSVPQVSDTIHIHDKDRHEGTSMLYTEDEELKNDSVISDNTLQLNEPCSCFHDQDYVEKIKKFQFYVDMVKKTVRPGCSPETLNVALSLMSSLVETLSVMSSKHYIHASL